MQLSDEAVKSVVENLERIYAVVVGLAISYAARKISEDGRPQESSGKLRQEVNWAALWSEVNWTALWNFVAFASTVVCFFHGMNRYFEKAFPYKGGLDDLAKQLRLIIDFIVFFIEAILLLLAGINLTARFHQMFRWLRLLFCVDFLWALAEFLRFGGPVALNFCLLSFSGIFFYTLILYFQKPEGRESLVRSLLVIATLSRNFADYYFNWKSFYFG